MYEEGADPSSWNYQLISTKTDWFHVEPERLNAYHFPDDARLGMVILTFEHFAVVHLKDPIIMPNYQFPSGRPLQFKFLTILKATQERVYAEQPPERLIERCQNSRCDFCAKKFDKPLIRGDFVLVDCAVQSLEITAQTEVVQYGNCSVLCNEDRGGNVPPLEMVVENYKLIYACPMGEFFSSKSRRPGCQKLVFC